jgi:hypothetical protein
MPIAFSLLPSDQRIYPSTVLDFCSESKPLEVATNEQFSFQLAFRNRIDDTVITYIKALESPWNVRIRRVGYVPMRHLNTALGLDGADVEGRGMVPGYVGDPLYEKTDYMAPPKETTAYWITVVAPPEGVAAGEYEIELEVETEILGTATRVPHRFKQKVKVHPVKLQPRNFSVTNWFYVDALMDWYKTDGFDERFWQLAERYIANLVSHGNDILFTPLLTPPLNGVKRPSQLLKVAHDGEGNYTFDWSDVARYVALGKACGVKFFEWNHLFSQWGVKKAIRVYEGQGKDERLLWPPETDATSEVYRNFLAQLLPALHRFLVDHDILECSMFHISDEPHGEEHVAAYRKAREMVLSIAPWIKTMDALSSLQDAKAAETDLPIPSIRHAHEFFEANVEAGCYYCCGPRGAFLNRLMDTPLAKIGMHGLVFYRWPIKLFLHWGYNYWYREDQRTMLDPFIRQDGDSWPRWAFGDPFVVYPGEEGPIDSIRWEVFAESLQDYNLLQTLCVDRNDPLLSLITGYDQFPKDAGWRRKVRAALFERANKQE